LAQAGGRSGEKRSPELFREQKKGDRHATIAKRKKKLSKKSPHAPGFRRKSERSVGDRNWGPKMGEVGVGIIICAMNGKDEKKVRERVVVAVEIMASRA